MAIIIVNIILMIVAIYLCCGFVFAVPFVLKGANAIDEGAHETTLGFKIIIIPATMVFWPLLLKKWIASAKNKNND